MKQNNGTRVLALGIDAAEPTFVQHLIERGEMPALKQLMERGSWKRVKSSAHIGSGSVWPTFITGTEAHEHGVYGEWKWQPETMSITRYSGHDLTPFWKSLADEGATIGMMDVPFAPTVGFSKGFEISEWGAHDALEGRMRFSPESLSDSISQTRTHPFQHKNIDIAGPDDYEQLTKLGSACLDGVKLRGELARRLMLETHPQFAIVAFTEIHRAAHYFWHNASPDHSFYAGDKFQGLRDTKSTLIDIYREIDRQIGQLVEVAGVDACVMVFSLHGMQPTLGTPAFLTPLLVETNWSRLADFASQSWRERAMSMFAALKRHAPPSLKKLYYKTLPWNATLHLAQPTMLPAYDWSGTRAFSLPTDQHGWIRLNLIGREAKGIVAHQEYEKTCRELQQMLVNLVTEDGRPVVRECLITSHSYDAAMTHPLPDLIVYYNEAAFDHDMRIKGMSFKAQSIGNKYTGQHAPEGFLITAGQQGIVPEDPAVSSTELHRMIINSLSMRT
jgi:predicted AlkP superfamily phosphohydrolase/phosphomutase